MTSRKLGIEKEKHLRHALINLSVAYAHISESASGTKPFKASKFLNILGKAIGDLRAELMIFLGDFDLNEVDFELPDWNSRRILKSLKKEEQEIEPYDFNEE